MSPIGVVTISNTMSLLIYELDDEKALVGTCEEDAEECKIEYINNDDDYGISCCGIYWGELFISLCDVMRI